jgi:hypothetical protein
MKTRELSLATFVLAAFGASIAACGAHGTSDAPAPGGDTVAGGAGSAGAPVTLPGAGSAGSLSNVAGAPAAYAGATGVAGAGVSFGGAPAAGGAPAVGGAPATTGCVLAAGTIADLSIDDVEDGNNAIQALGSRKGFWYTYNDGSGAQVPAPDPTGKIPFTPTAGGHSPLFSAHTNGPAFTIWGAGMGFDFNNTTGQSCPYDASAYTGIKFWAKGNMPLKAMVKIPGTTTKVTAADSNTCVSTTMCEDHYFLQPKPTLTAAWTQYTITFADSTSFAQEGWGIKVPAFDKAHIIGVQFQVAMGTAFDFAIDDVTFF